MSSSNSANSASPVAIDTLKRTARRKAIESADLPESTKLLLLTMQDHGEEELDVNRTGHAATAGAIREQTKFVGVAGLVIVLFAMAGLMLSNGVDPMEAAEATKALVDVATPAPAAAEAPPAPAPEVSAPAAPAPESPPVATPAPYPAE